MEHPEVRYEVTDNCNAHCIMCPREKHDRPHGIMDQDKYERSIDEIVWLGAKRVVLTGFGEPMLDRNLEKKIAYANAKGLKTYIITNASCLTKKRSKELIDAGLDEMRISFYGMSTYSYNHVMVGLDYKKAIENITYFLSLKSKTKVHLSYLELPINERETEKFKEYWEPLVDAIEIWKPHNWVDGKDYRKRKGDKKTCGRPENGPLQIQWDGTVVPCCYDYNNNIVLGNAFENPVMEILSGERYRVLREQHKTGNFPSYCDQCDQLLEHSDALVYTNRHTLSNEEAVKLSNTDLYNLQDAKEFQGE